MMESMLGTGRNWTRKSIEEIALSLIEEGSGDGEAGYDVDNVWVPCCDSIASQKKLVPLRLYKRSTSGFDYEHGKLVPPMTPDSTGEAYYWMIIARSDYLPIIDGVWNPSPILVFSNSSDVGNYDTYYGTLKDYVSNRLFAMTNRDGNVVYNHMDVTADEHFTIRNHPCRMFLKYRGDNTHKSGWYEIINRKNGTDSNVTLMTPTAVVTDNVFHKDIKAFNLANQGANWLPFSQCAVDAAVSYFGIEEEDAKRDLRTLFPAFAFGKTGANKADVEPQYVTLTCPECHKEFNVKPDPAPEPEPGEDEEEEPQTQTFYCPYCGAEVVYTYPEVEPDEGEEEDPDANFYFFKPFDIVDKIVIEEEEEDEGENS